MWCFEEYNQIGKILEFCSKCLTIGRKIESSYISMILLKNYDKMIKYKMSADKKASRIYTWFEDGLLMIFYYCFKLILKCCH